MKINILLLTAILAMLAVTDPPGITAEPMTVEDMEACVGGKPLTDEEVEVLGLNETIMLGVWGRVESSSIIDDCTACQIIQRMRGALNPEVDRLRAEVKTLKTEVELLQAGQIIYGPLVVFGEICQASGTAMICNIACGEISASGDGSFYHLEVRGIATVDALSIRGVDIPPNLPARVEALEALVSKPERGARRGGVR
jgi:hypothetical protein